MPVAMNGHRPTLKTVLDTVATLAMLVTAVVLLWIFLRPAPAPAAPSRAAIPVPAEPLSLDGAPLLGAVTAPVVMIEFSDFQCPFCGKATKETLPELRAAYVDTGRVQLAFRHLPLPIHPRARPAAEVAACAATQGRFWPMHDLLFADAGKLEEADLRADAVEAGVTLDEACVTGAGAARVTEDLALAKALKLTGTPVFLIGRRLPDGRVKVLHVLPGARPSADFRGVLDELLTGK